MLTLPCLKLCRVCSDGSGTSPLLSTPSLYTTCVQLVGLTGMWQLPPQCSHLTLACWLLPLHSTLFWLHVLWCMNTYIAGIVCD